MVEAAVMGFFPLLMAFAAFSDMTTMTISNRLSLVLAIGFAPVALLVGAPLPAIGLHLLCGLAIFALTFALFSFNIIGGGDAKLAAATSIWIGWEELMNYGLLTAVVGGLLALALIFARRFPLPSLLSRRPWILRLHDPATGVPYGIALAAAGLALYPESLVWLRAVGA